MFRLCSKHGFLFCLQVHPFIRLSISTAKRVLFYTAPSITGRVWLVNKPITESEA